MKIPLTLLIGIILSMFFACQDEKTDVPIKKAIYTNIDREHYHETDSLFFGLKNLLDSPAFFYVCSGYPKPIPEIEKLEKNIWLIERSPLCNDFSSYCCGEFIKTGTIGDAITLEGLEPGTYRLKFTFSVYNSESQLINYESRSTNFFIE